jgi:ubiquinol-cytochrome c reductase cytochrome c subunit
VRRALLLGLAWALVAAGAAAAEPSPQLVHAGARLFGRYCATCHGGGGRGIEPGEQNSGGGPGRSQERQQGAGPDLFGVGALAADFYLRTGYMPLPDLGVQPKHRAHLLLSAGQINALTAYVASLGHGPAIPTPRPERGNLSSGMQLFTQHCSGCHQVAAAGGYVTGGVAPALDQVSPREVAEAVRVGPYLMPVFSEKQISDAELDSIIRYVEYTKHPDDPGGWALAHIGPVPEGLVTWFVGIVSILGITLALGKRLRT